MTAIDQLKNHYDKLTARERFALMVAAGARGYKAERETLYNSAPKVTFEFPHCKGLSEGFDFLTSWHMIQQLGAAGTFWMLTYWQEGDDDTSIATIEGKQYTTGEAKTLAARRFMEGLEAYKAICKEYDIDSQTLEGMYPGFEMILAMTEIIICRAFEIAPTELTDLEATKDAYRQIVEHSREQWAETRAK